MALMSSTQALLVTLSLALNWQQKPSSEVKVKHRSSLLTSCTWPLSVYASQVCRERRRGRGRGKNGEGVKEKERQARERRRVENI